jgi:hypothetical protein
LLAVFFIWLGIGTLKGRRWARAIMLVVSWLWLIGGLFGMGFWLIMAPRMFDYAPPGQAPMPDAMKSLMTILMTGFMVFVYVIVPGIFVLFYGRRDVKATFEFRDPHLRWTDRCPLPVLAVSFILGYMAMGSLFSLVYGVAPFFGRILTGATAAAVILLIAVRSALLTRGTYRLRMWSWWGAVTLVVIGSLSSVITFSRHSMVDFYRVMGFSEQQLEMIAAYDIWRESNLVLWTVACAAVSLGYLFYIRRYFGTASAGAAA